MLSGLVLLLAASQAPSAEPPTPGRSAWIFVTLDRSEWCPAGNVRLHLRSGRYALTRQAPRPACQDKALERPVERGVLDPRRLAAVKTAAARAFAEGFESRTCRDGGPPENVILSNAGRQLLILTTGQATESAPDDQSCWSASATALHRLLDETFAPEPR